MNDSQTNSSAAPSTLVTFPRCDIHLIRNQSPSPTPPLPWLSLRLADTLPRENLPASRSCGTFYSKRSLRKVRLSLSK